MFADVTDSGGRKACGYFAKLGSCFQRDCPLAHIEVEGARPGKKEDSPRCVESLVRNSKSRRYMRFGKSRKSRPEKLGGPGPPTQVSIYPKPRSAMPPVPLLDRPVE